MVFIHWAGFIGAWLLVAGPLYQAAVELVEDAIQAEDIRESAHGAPPVDEVSLWWWLLPPVYYVKRRNASKRQRDAMMRMMTPEQRTRALILVNKAGGWLTVAAGAFLIALKETGELAELNHWPALVYVVIILVLAVASVWNAVERIRHGRALLAAYEAEEAAAAGEPDASRDSA